MCLIPKIAKVLYITPPLCRILSSVLTCLSRGGVLAAPLEPVLAAGLLGLPVLVDLGADLGAGAHLLLQPPEHRQRYTFRPRKPPLPAQNILPRPHLPSTF